MGVQWAWFLCIFSRWLLLSFKREFSHKDGLRIFEIVSSRHLEVSSVEAEMERSRERARELEKDGTFKFSSFAIILLAYFCSFVLSVNLSVFLPCFNGHFHISIRNGIQKELCLLDSSIKRRVTARWLVIKATNHARHFLSCGFQSASGYLSFVRCLAIIRHFILWRVSDEEELLVCWKYNSAFLCDFKSNGIGKSHIRCLRWEVSVRESLGLIEFLWFSEGSRMEEIYVSPEFSFDVFVCVAMLQECRDLLMSTTDVASIYQILSRYTYCMISIY